MILTNEQFNRLANPRMRRGTSRPGFGAPPAPAAPAALLPALQQENAALRRRIAELQQKLARAAQLVRQLQAQGGTPVPVPAAQRVVEMRPAASGGPAPSASRAPTPQERAFYGDHLKGSHPHDFGGDLDGLDAELGLED